jgi:SAM-dependent methyltransferase
MTKIGQGGNVMSADSKAWDWKRSASERWSIPSEISYYLVHRWKSRGYTDFLDLGCGPGRHSLQFAEAGFTVFSMDLSEDAVASLADRARASGAKLKASCGDMRRLPYGDASMDCLLAYHVVSHTDTRGIREVIGELRRVLRPGGEFYLTLCSKKAWSYEEAGFERADENTVIKREDGPEDGVPHFFVDEAGIADLFKDLRIMSLQHVQDLVVDGSPYRSWHYFLLGAR